MATFDTKKRAKLVALLESGRQMGEACAQVGVTSTTVNRWVARGRREQGTPAAKFAQQIDDFREGRGEKRLIEEDVVRLVEQAARKGSVTAMKLLLDRFAKERDANQHPSTAQTAEAKFDELAARRRTKRS